MRLILVTFIVTCLGCQKRQTTEIAAEFTVYTDSFEAAYGRSIPALSVQFGPVSVSGQCHIKRDQLDRIVKREIIINKTHWDLYGEVAKKATIWHELGHCVLMRPHRPGGSISYMAEYFGGPEPTDDLAFLMQYQSTMDNELFWR